MRDLIFFTTFLPLPFLSFLYPWIGLLVWGWLALMNPHRQLWGFATSFSYNHWIALATLAGFFIMAREHRLRIDANLILLFLLAFCIVLSSIFSPLPSFVWIKGEEYIKLIVFAVLAHIMLDRKIRVHAFVWMLALCLGFFGVKGGTLFILSAGNHNFTGPSNSMISDRNHLAVALLMVIPLMNYLRLHTADRWLRIGLIAAMVFTVFAIVGTSSRGGFIGLLAMAGFLWVRSRNKVLTGLLMLPVIIGLTFVAPERWVERMQTIDTAAEEDGSFKGRLNAWQTYFNAAVDRPFLGVGPFGLNRDELFLRYQPYEGIVDYENRQGARAAHSIYFQVMGELGFAGFFVYILLAATAFFNTQQVIRSTKGKSDLLWAHDLARMLQVSFVAFFVAGAGVSIAMYDFYLALTATAAALRMLVNEQLPARVTRRVSPVPSGKVAS